MSSLADKISLKLGKRYVYFSSLKQNEDLQVQSKIQKLEKNLTTGVKTRTTRMNSDKQKSQMDLALDFLASSAENERTKELQFFQNFTADFPETQKLFNLDFKNIDKDYLKFINNINITLKGTNNFEHELKTEIDRMKRYQKSKEFTSGRNIIEGKEKQYYNALSAHGRKESAADVYFKRDSVKTFEGLIQNGTIASEITKYIMSNFGGKIMTFAGGNLQLNSANFATLIKVLNDKAYAMLVDYYGKVGTIKNNKLSNQLNNTLFTQEYEKFVNNLLEAPTLSNTLTSIAEQFGITDETMSKVTVTKNDIETLTHNLKLAHKNLQSTEDFDTWFNNNKGALNLDEIVRSIGSISSICYYTGEGMGAAELISNHIGAIIGGRANTTDDILAGKITIRMSLNIKQQESVKQYEQRMDNLRQEYFNQLTKTTDLDSFQKNTQQLRELREQQTQQLEELQKKITKGKKGLEHLIDHINIHDTIKGYSSAGSDYFKNSKGFEGASFGSNLDEQLKILSEVNATGGLSKEDIEFFKFAMINAGSQMIGAPLKRDLEDYFSVFLTFFMFNDAQLMIEDAQTFARQQTSKTGVGDLHIYQLNGVYVPSSYLLQKTYEQLTNAASQIKSMSKTQGTRAILHTYNEGYQKGKSWTETYEEAEKKTKLEMRFLGGFFDLLDNMSKAMKNLG